MLGILPGISNDVWHQFKASWDDLVEDRHMADAGRYRRRRYAAFRMTADAIERLPHRPHFQDRRFNHLNGGIERWFAPVEPAIAGHPITDAILTACQDLVAACQTCQFTGSYDVELHQFRIEAAPSTGAKPTPEGMHRDGVDYACAMLINRENIQGGSTRVDDENGVELETSTLAAPLDSLFLDDRRVRHGVSNIGRADIYRPGLRDVLVITFRCLPDQVPTSCDHIES
jgi:hypothetical protein